MGFITSNYPGMHDIGPASIGVDAMHHCIVLRFPGIRPIWVEALALLVLVARGSGRRPIWLVFLAKAVT